MPKIFLYCYPAPNWGTNDVVGYALAEDGTGLASHLSSNIGFNQHDMGLTSNWKHEAYEKHYPEGFELEWVDDPDNHPGVAAAYALNQQAVEHRVQRTALRSAPFEYQQEIGNVVTKKFGVIRRR